MRQKKCESLIPYLMELKKAMKLADWDLRLCHEPAGSECDAQIAITTGRKVAVVQVGEDFFDASPESQRHTLVHELIHPHVHGMELACDMLANAVGKSSSEIASRAFSVAMEYAVDGLADAIAPNFPTPAQFAAGHQFRVYQEEKKKRKK